MVVNSLMEMEVATPAKLTPTVTSVATTVGNLMNLMLGGGGAADQANSTGNGTDTVDPCAGVAVGRHRQGGPEYLLLFRIIYSCGVNGICVFIL